jgi:hypothetical protein
MFNEFDAGDDFSCEQEMYENDLELRGNNEAWEDAQAEMAEDDAYYGPDMEDEYDDDSMYGSEFNEPGDYGYDDQY